MASLSLQACQLDFELQEMIQEIHLVNCDIPSNVYIRVNEHLSFLNESLVEF
jgi:type III secretion system FlhB-like substrate exporter